MAVLTGLYVILGGYMATAINDFIQGIVMLLVLRSYLFSIKRTGWILQLIVKTCSTGAYRE